MIARLTIPENTSLEQVWPTALAKGARFLDGMLEGPWWQMKAVLLVLAVCLLRAFPSYDALGSRFVEQKWNDALVKADRPLADMGRLYPPESHESKLTFRMTVPLVARVLRLRMTGVLVLSGVLGALLLWLSLMIAFEVSQSRRAALWIALAVGCSWAGEAAFHELRGGYYDAAALVLLMLAIQAKVPGLVALWTFAAAWTDERALLAVPCVLLFHFVQRASGVRASLGVLMGLCGYGLSRLCMTETGGYATTLAGTGLELLGRQLNVLPMALWSGLGGCWVPVLGGAAVLAMRRRWGLGVVFTLMVGALSLSAFCVIDTTRSVAYLLPAAFVGLAVLRRSESRAWVERLAAAAGLLSFFVPAFYLEGGSGVWWLYPLPVQAARWLVPFLPGL
ncbi:hypothetical protein [uncultured Paludibaculum sp.]|uniref:hypothetical protein n=1 Tax=uncultured Paludibaculum sp. TaxID=1765020 RepID=UPI002AABA0B9|nr:hypothetical protein [uncultured Paludibaculum sp.]